jgi:hypothetical protein
MIVLIIPQPVSVIAKANRQAYDPNLARELWDRSLAVVSTYLGVADAPRGFDRVSNSYLSVSPSSPRIQAVRPFRAEQVRNSPSGACATMFR